jgi:hypothetical protein
MMGMQVFFVKARHCASAWEGRKAQVLRIKPRVRVQLAKDRGVKRVVIVGNF